MLTKPSDKTRGTFPWVFRCVIVVWALSLPAAHAENACGAMASRHNPNAMNGGIGGTGAPASAGESSSESVAQRPGIGGTGAVGDGIGGTGLMGVITGFASICVNGVEVHYNANTPVSADGDPTSLGSLAVGQVVAVQAIGEGDQLSARNIAVMHAAVGPVDRVDRDAGQFQMLGQSVQLADKAVLSGLHTGHWVQVSGYRLVSGELVASGVEPIAPRAQAQVIGQMDALSGNGFNLHGARVNLDGIRLATDAVPGTEVSVRGQWDGTTLHAQAVTVEPSRQNLGGVDRVVLEGYVHAVNRNELSLGNRVLTLAEGVRISGTASKTLAVNQRVQVSGRVGKDQRVTVDGINVRSNSSNTQSKRVRVKDADEDRKTDDKATDASATDNSGRSSDDGDSSGSGSSGTSGSSSGSSGRSSSGSSGSGSSGKGSSGGGGSGGGKK